MLSSPSRFSYLRHLGTAVTIAGILGGVALIVFGAIGSNPPTRIWFVIGGIGLMGAGVMALTLTRLLLKIESNTSRAYNELRDLHHTVSRYGQTLVMVADNTSISESTKSIAHRGQERDALRAAVYEEIRREDFEAAFYLIDELDRRLGFRADAERLRSETAEARDVALHDKLDEALAHINRLLDQRNWVQAQHEIDRLGKLMPSDERIAGLQKQLTDRRMQYKQELLNQWNAAVADNNVDRGIKILKELDLYLSRDEARSMESDAREFFKERLQQLSVKFQFAAKEKRWRDTLETGLEIIEEFPNSGVAKEVQDHLDDLRDRAGYPVDVEVTARGKVSPTDQPAA